MTDTEIPRNHAGASVEGTPRLTIHYEATVDLDSTNVFEGPEKLLEVWFSPSPSDLPASASPVGLKAVSSQEWETMLDLVNCKVLSVVASEHMDAYLLSESSMFVFPHKLILKTCGITTLLSGLPRMLEIAAQSAGLAGCQPTGLAGVSCAATPYRVFYSRKNFLFPDKQRGPHRSWSQEVRFLDRMFVGGSAYMVGKMNGEHWYLYITSPDTRLTPPPTPEWERFDPSGSATDPADVSYDGANRTLGAAELDVFEDETLEILMTDLDPENAKQFYSDHASAVADDPACQRLLRAQEELVKAHGIGASQTCVGKNDGPCEGAANSSDEVDILDNCCTDVNGSGVTASEARVSSDVITTEGHVLGSVVSETCGLSAIYPPSQYPDARMDAYLFSPCGFSANGVIPAPARGKSSATSNYFTVHVTPEPHCSYASFETNVPSKETGTSTAELVERVVSIFRPGRFSVTLFEANSGKQQHGTTTVHSNDHDSRDPPPSGLATVKRSARMECIEGYRRIERIVHDLDGYDLVFRCYERDGWKTGVPPRLGEV